MNKFLTLLAALTIWFGTAQAQPVELTLTEGTVNFTGTRRPALAINGSIPGPIVRLREGEQAVIRVTNRTTTATSIHWHGLILPAAMDGAPGFSPGFANGIAPGETFEYRFPVRQSGTFWYHAHNLDQEQRGVYGAVIIAPRAPDPVRADRDYIVQLSEWTDSAPSRVLANLRRDPGYYNWNRRTLVDLLGELGGAPDNAARGAVIRDRLSWGNMRMDPTDLSDVSGGTYSFLINGRTPAQNPTMLFRAGEKIRLRFINSGAMTYFDIRIPGARMTVIQADGNNVQPVQVDEFRIAVGETYDVIVEPRDGSPLQIIAEPVDRTGMARATLVTSEGQPPAVLPPNRPRALLTMADMVMTPGPTGLDRGTLAPERDQPGHVMPSMAMAGGAMAAPAAAPAMPGMPGMAASPPPPAMPGMAMPASGADDPVALDTGAPPGARVLSYRDLRPLRADPEWRPYDRIIEMRLTGNMERYMWSMNGNEFWQAQPIVARLGERLRIRFINETMMNHPMHLHGMWMVPDLGNGAFNPRKHVVNIRGGRTLDVDVIVDAEGDWAFHCHLLYHMEAGMMRVFRVVRDLAAPGARAPAAHGRH